MRSCRMEMTQLASTTEMAEETNKSIEATRVFVDEDNNCGIFTVVGLARYQVSIARNGKITVSGAGVNWQTSRQALHAAKHSLIGQAMLAVLTWETSPTS